MGRFRVYKVVNCDFWMGGFWVIMKKKIFVYNFLLWKFVWFYIVNIVNIVGLKKNVMMFFLSFG